MLKIGSDEVVCGLCDGALEVSASPDSKDTFRCIGCGNNDTLDNIRRIVSEFITDSIKQPSLGSVGKPVFAGKASDVVLKFKPKGGHYSFHGA